MYVKNFTSFSPRFYLGGHQGGSVAQTRIHRNIAKQLDFSKSVSDKTIFDHSLTEISVFEEKSLHYFKDIRNIMGVFGFIP